MGKVSKLYNQNRHIIWIIILVIVAIIVLIQILNNFVSKKENEEVETKQNTVINSSNDNIDKNFVWLL